MRGYSCAARHSSVGGQRGKFIFECFGPHPGPGFRIVKQKRERYWRPGEEEKRKQRVEEQTRKTIADTLRASVRKKVEQAGKKMRVTMSHRFRQDITTLRHELRSGRDGELAT